MLICIITGDSPPTYSFTLWISWVLAVFVWLSIATITWRYPISFLPDAQVKWQFRRLIRSADALLASLTAEAGAAPGAWQRWRRRSHLKELTALPARLGSWARLLPGDALGNSDQGAYTRLVANLQVFSDRLSELFAYYNDLQHRYPKMETRGKARPLGALGEEILSELRDVLLQLNDPGGLETAACSARLERARIALEKWVNGAVDSGSQDGSLSHEAVLDLYRVLGAYRGTLEALAGVSESVQAVDWDSLYSARF